MRSRTLSTLLLVAAALCPACTPNKAYTPPLVTPGAVVPATPAAPAAVELELLGELANRTVLAQQPGEVLARIRIHSPESEDAPRPRANIGLVVDTSASMRGDAIAQARVAALTLLHDLRDGDVMSVVVFGSGPQVLVPATVLDAQTRPTIRAAIDTMEATGTTDLAGGLSTSLGQVQGQARSGEINRIVLVSDGVPNDETPVDSIAQQARSAGVSITTLGLGLDYHETLLGRIAQTSGGTFHFVEDPAEVAAVFSEEVLRIDRLSAQGVALELAPGPGVTIVDVPGQTLSRSGRTVVVGLPDLAEGDTQQVIVKLTVGEHHDGATVELLDGRLRYADARTGQARQQGMFLSAQATADPQARAAGLDLEVAVAAARATTAAATLQIVSLARMGEVEEAESQLDQTLTHARSLSEDMPDPQLAALIDGLVELRPTLPGLAPPPPPPSPSQSASTTKTKRKAPRRAGDRPEVPRFDAEPFPGDAGSTGVAQPTAMGSGEARGVRANHERAYNILHGG